MKNENITWMPPMDLYELDDDYILNAEIPGVERRNVKIEFSGLKFTVQGERKFDLVCAEENYHRLEGRRGKFQRTFSLPEPVDGKRMQLELKNGVLRIVLPKTGGAKNRSRGVR
jgi:HSP20 family protein